MNAQQRARTSYDGLSSLGYTIFTGVPCSLLNGFYRALEESKGIYSPRRGRTCLLALRPASLWLDSAVPCSCRIQARPFRSMHSFL